MNARSLAASLKLTAGLDLVIGDIKCLKCNYFAPGSDWEKRLPLLLVSLQITGMLLDAGSFS